nr:MBOAT family protein [Clostridia bacterium]
MLFSSLSFLLYFFPAVILLHYFLPQRLQNAFLLAASLLFYAWGDARQVPLFAVLLMMNWGAACLMARAGEGKARRALLIGGLVIDFGALVFYKYTGFLLGIVGLYSSYAASLTLPLGISFFIFQAAGYLIDVYRGQTLPEKDPVSFGAFLFLFPQLIAGPIVRYSDMSKALHEKRRPSAAALESGMALFAAGLAAKVLLANPLGEAYDALRAVEGDMLCAWGSLAAYTLQIYFDFMGYSVMAVGLGRMLGFGFPRNFNHPYAAVSVTDFWRRWHVTLSGWFRDYVYIPLGGSRKGRGRTALNLLAVWSLTGLWHGADWNFLLWGMWYFLLLSAEKFLLADRVKLPQLLRRVLTLLGVMLGWALFVSDGLAGFADYMAALFSFGVTAQSLFWLQEFAGIILLGAVFCVPRVVEGLKALCRRYALLRYAAVIGTLILCLASLAKSSYNPFLYFRF